MKVEKLFLYPCQIILIFDSHVWQDTGRQKHARKFEGLRWLFAWEGSNPNHQ